jgi:hypothetical protein
MQKNEGNRNNNSTINSNATKNEEDILHIGGRIFRKVKLGLAAEEVRAYVEELIGQRDALVKRQEHLAALMELAEKTVIDANNLAQTNTKKAAEQAKAEADIIRARAEQEVAQFVKTRKAEAIAAAEKEAETIKADAQRQARTIREQQLDGIRSEAASLAQKLQNDLIADIEGMKKSVMTIGKQFSDTQPINASVVGKDNESALFEGEKVVLSDDAQWVDIEIMPPMDIDKIMDLIAHLEGLPEVKTTDLLPEDPDPFIRVFLRKPLALANMLRTLPHIAQVTELFDSNSVDAASGKKREIIQVVFGTNSGRSQQSRKDAPQRTTQ